MNVTELHLENFRNYGSMTTQFGESVNIITGNNAQGKTNIIEAIFYLATGKSFRQASDKEMISHDKENAYIRAGVISDGRKQMLEARLFRGRRRELYANDVKLKKASELTGRLSAVQFGPDDLNLVKEGASVRRKLMDQCLSQLRPGYLAALTEFNRLYDHKTRILRDYREKPALLDLLDDFDLCLAQQSARLIYYRTAFAAMLSRRAVDIHHDFSAGSETLSIKYKTVGDMDAAGMKPEQILPALLEHQRDHRQAELKSGMCLSGAHKDDLEIGINGSPARKFGSQGQMRTAAVSIKLAERDIHYDERGEYPILLLDDVLSELDETRRAFILGRIMNGQVFVTCCENTAASAIRGGNMFMVEKGEICTFISDKT